VSGPGDVRILQRGGTDPLSAPGRADAGKPGPAQGTPVSVARTGPERKPGPADKAVPEDMKMTYVTFLNRMDGNSKTGTAKFWGAVRVLNFPCDNPREEIDIDALLARDLPPGFMYMRCNRLEVLDRPENGRPNQQMRAYGRVRVQAKEFFAEADEVSYEEQKDLIILKGDKNNPATLTKRVPNEKDQTLTAQKILYQRSTGKATAEDTDALIGH
jgi:hypothetical protein